MSYLRAFGTYVPERVVTSAEIAALVDMTADDIVAKSGIEERHYAAENEDVVSLAVAAAEDCLRNAGVVPAEIGMLIVASGSADRFCPGPAASVAARLGLSQILALDVPVASAGSLIAMHIAMQFASSAGKVLVVASEVMSRRVQLTPDGRDTAILFGDGAGACLIDAHQGFLKLKDALLATDGNACEILRMEGGLLHMEGGSVILQAARKIPAAIKTLLERNALTSAELSVMLMHQANVNLIEKVAKSIGLPMERCFVNIRRYGNTSSASMLIAAAEWHSANPGPVQSPVLFAAFGAGLNWGALLATPEVVTPEEVSA
ncbi:3-oxoacyl-ACP synthase III family protein [Silvibacterium dinghuense]|uniref:Ketoacyl-ACP synthase III n=1 Tax=Silvibacterium dinghuense TaxID=1560006 RepID=A0A4Q1S9L3_9BACT|nr:ketoacyl-ACP synthase III [Silvibacterium dinghuense]RXS93667.1 ketoacyl-ACP synthase III [Silvibacterium dinghuense]GGH06635.1 3-oxoacyl-[acyl-carrier-protein] synthase 3 [Silvibacterium dinghuense]